MKIKHVYGNVLRLDIPLTVKIVTSEGGHTQETEEPFYPDTSKPVLVELANKYNITKYTYDATMTENVAHIEDRGDIKVGIYKVTVKCFDEQGQPYRYMARDIIDIVDATADAGIEAGIEFDSETYTLEGAYFIKGEKGDKGDPFTYDDFTPEQIVELQRPATEAAERADEAISDIRTLEQSVESAESQRTLAESQRVLAEQTRQQNESSRTSNETSRQNAENTRQQNENARQGNESTRQNNESSRQNAETSRQQNEAQRVTKEQQRVSQEASRVTEFATLKQASIEAIALTQEVASHPDIVGDNGNWWRWDTADGEYKDTGTPALNVVTYDINASTGELQMTVIDGMDYPHMEVVEGNLVLEVNS